MASGGSKRKTRKDRPRKRKTREVEKIVRKLRKKRPDTKAVPVGQRPPSRGTTRGKSETGSLAARRRPAKATPPKKGPPRSPPRGGPSKGQGGGRTGKRQVGAAELSRRFSKAMGAGVLPIEVERGRAKRESDQERIRAFEREQKRLAPKVEKARKALEKKNRARLAEALAQAKHEEALEGLKRKKERRRLFERGGAKMKKEQREALGKLLETNRRAAKTLGLPPKAVRGYRYDDGHVVVRLQVPASMGIVKVEKALRGRKKPGKAFLPEGTYLEGNVMFDSRKEIKKQIALYPEKYPRRFRGLQRLQFWGSKNPVAALFALGHLVKKLEPRGLAPEYFQIRTSISIDGTQPFVRTNPPKGGSKRRAKTSHKHVWGTRGGVVRCKTCGKRR
jgi:hypothetical protein